MGAAPPPDPRACRHAPAPPPDVDERVRGLVAAGDADGAATVALRVLGPQVMRYLRSILRDGDDAADAFSRFAERLWQALPAFRGDCSLRAFCHRIAWSQAQHLQHEAYRCRRVRLRSGLVCRIGGGPQRSSSGDERRVDRLAALRAELDPDERSLLVLRLEQRLSWREAALVLALPGEPVPSEAALRKRFERTKEKIAALARERGLIE